MEQKRKFQRFPIDITAGFVGVGYRTERQCKITEISGKGLVVKLYLDKNVREGQNLLLEIRLDTRQITIPAVVSIKWIERIDNDEQFNCIAGAKITLIKNEHKQALMNYAYDMLIKGEQEHD